jgi:signal transduction histidine kinase/ActR/RegA family two-component response regulator
MPQNRQAGRDLAEGGGLPSLLIYPVLALTTGMAGELWTHQPSEIWACVVLTTLFGSVRVYLGKRLRNCSAEDVDRLANWYSATVLAVAAIWSLYSCSAVAHFGRNWTGLMAVMTTVGIVAGAISTLTTHFRLMIAYVLIMIVPSTLAMISFRGNTELLTASILFYFALFMIVAGRRHNMRYKKLNAAMFELDSAQAKQSELLEQEKLQTALLAKQNAELQEARLASEKANLSKSAFLATMSHEIRTPMNAICGITNLLLETETSETQRNWLSTLRNSSESLLGLISDILDLSKIEAQQMKTEMTPFGLRELIVELIHLMQPVAQTKGLQLELVLGPSLPPTIISDRLRLRQILLNLMGNAIKFSDRGQVKIEAQAADQELQISVTDHGIGIPPAAFERLFQPFSQVNDKTTRVHGGTGLGLAISRELARLLGGSLWMSSNGKCAGQIPSGWEPPELEIGSQFWVRIPLQVGELSPQESAPSTEVTQDQLATLKILVAEDNRINQMVIQATLSKMGHNVQLVESGKAAVEAIESEDFSIVFMDLQMPEMDGLEATRTIRASGKKTPWIVALTANAFVEDKQQCFEAGMNDYLSKPVRRQDLQRAINAALQQSSSMVTKSSDIIQDRELS